MPELLIHPQHLLSDEEHLILDLWLDYRPDGMGSRGRLPFSGALTEQPAALIQMLQDLSAVEAKVRKLTQGPGK